MPELLFVRPFETDRSQRRPRAERGGWLLWVVVVIALLALAFAPVARADQVEFTEFEITNNEEGVQVNFAVRFDLPRAVDEALSKGVPLYFVAEAELLRDRWYWRDKRVNKVTRVWRVAYQPLTRKYRVTFGGLNQSFETAADALAAVRRVGAWKIAEPAQLEDGGHHYVEFSYRLDTTLLPRPMQIGIGGQPEWTLLINRLQRVN